MAVVILSVIVLAAVVGITADRWLGPNLESGAIGSAHSGDVDHELFHGTIENEFYPCTPEDIRDNATVWTGFVRCQQSRAGVPIEMALVGDSHAEHLFLGLAEALPETNIVYYILNDRPVRSSSPGMARILDYVASEPTIRTVLVNSFWRSRRVPESELRETLEQLVRSGKAVFVTDDVPDFPFGAFQCRYGISPIIPVSRCTISELESTENYESYIGSLQRAVSSVPGVGLLMTHKYFCSSGACSMAIGNDLFYRDGHHLNMKGSRFLAHRLLNDNPGFAKAASSP